MDVIIDFRHDVSELESCGNGSSSSYIESAKLTFVNNLDNCNLNSIPGTQLNISLLKTKLEVSNNQISDLENEPRVLQAQLRDEFDNTEDRLVKPEDGRLVHVLEI